ncbi:MAG: saccharopine dehydrogenase NADP-binding domain-containing protein [Synechococcales cyanobacterium C42_A2020_086]|jgi:saccharopine dehydrogenase-like NADP-dependent oxidoreductase|nr:saccharopine dehydrogenase NADP-binding domain-containing protein [Synechococcales cyanobacterium C42_A2020_086]
MSDRVLILGGRGRIGRSVTADLLAHTSAAITVTGRTEAAKPDWDEHQDPHRLTFLRLDLADRAAVDAAVQGCRLVIHCAGPFRYRDTSVLQSCIQQGVDYLDVSDDRSFTRKALAHRAAAQTAGVTAIVNSGVFPGISNSMVRQGVEQLDRADRIHLSYVVSGSGGAGVTVMRTTFLGLQHPFEAWIDGQWQLVKPYTDRETVTFPPPYGTAGVYWFDMPEAYTLVEAFPVQTVITKFGSVPDLYNHLTWMAAHWLPSALMRHSGAIEFLSKVSHAMTQVSDRFSGIGVAMRAEVQGEKQGQLARYCATFAHENTAVAAGYGVGSIAQLLLAGQLQQPGVWSVEQALPTPLFEQTLQQRGVQIQQEWL